MATLIVGGTSCWAQPPIPPSVNEERTNDDSSVRFIIVLLSKISQFSSNNRRHWWSTATGQQRRDERDQKQADEDVGQQNCDARGGSSDSAETKNGRNHRNDEKYKTPVKHGNAPFVL